MHYYEKQIIVVKTGYLKLQQVNNVIPMSRYIICYDKRSIAYPG